MRSLYVTTLAFCVLLASACQAEQNTGAGGAPPPPAPPSAERPAPPSAQPTIAPPPPGAGTGATGLTWTVPAGWASEVPSTSMRKAQYRVPGSAGDAECIVFYFGPGQGGGAMANAQRWATQFTLDDGRPGDAGMTTESRKVGGMEVLVVAVSGTYQGGFRMQAQQPAPEPNQMLLAAIAEGPDANWFFKLTGPRATVEEQRAAFDELVASFTPGASPP
jgi:hypothetical protein